MFKTVRLEITGVCDIQCLYCHAGQKNTSCYKQDELSHERWLEIISECKSIGVTDFILTGGEFFLYDFWPEIIEACGQDSKVIISTNGRHFSEKNINILKNFLQVKEFRTSLDGLLTNDVIRDGSSYKESLEAIEGVRSFLPEKKVMVQTVVYRQNLLEIMPLYEELKRVGVYRWRLSQLWKTVRTEKNSGIVDFSDYDTMFNLYVEVIKRFQADSKPFMLSIDNVYYSWIEKEDYAPMSLLGHPCEYNFDYLCINANGDLIFCPALSVVFSSVKNQSIQKAVSGSDWLADFKRIKVSSFGCGKCRYIKICGGGCRADSLRWLGRVDVIDPNSCCMMLRIEDKILPLLSESERAAFSVLIDKDGSLPPISGKNIEEAVNFFKKEG